MERLTKVDDQSRLLAYSISDTGLPAIITSGNPYRKLIEKLKLYEDTGLEPGKIVELKELLESAMEELENVYQRETELTERIREVI